MNKLNPNKTCASKICKKKFAQQRPLQMVCSPQCGFDYSDQMKEKRENEDWRETKKLWQEKHKTYGKWLKELQTIFNLFIRTRDKKEPCISCGKNRDVEYDAGHFYPVSLFPNLRFHEDNVHKQCAYYCNKELGGNIHNYRPRLIEKIGRKRFDSLNSLKSQPLKLSVPELIELKVIYKDKIKKLKENE